jgi:hypothetical protein
MTEESMLKEMFLLELGQADFKAIGRSRGFDPQTMASPQLMQHVFLSEQGVAAALASLSETEFLGLHLLNCIQDEVGLEFFRKMYPDSTPRNPFYGTYTEQYKGLFQQVKTQLIRRGLLLFGTLTEHESAGAVLERRRFRFPEVFASLLPAPFKVSKLSTSAAPQYRRELLRQKVTEILTEAAALSAKAVNEEGRWRLAEGELLFGGQPFRVERLQAWQSRQFEVAVGYTNRALPKPLLPVPLLRYALSRLREDEWLAPSEVLPVWKMVLAGAKVPEPQAVCETGFQWACLEKAEQEGASYYRLSQQSDAEADSPPEAFLDLRDAVRVRICLERTPLAALARLAEISRFEAAGGELWAKPNLLKISHAPDRDLTDPVVCWLREHHAAFRGTIEMVEERKGKVIVHENLLVARVNDLGLKVMLEKKFGGPGQLVALAAEYVAIPKGLLPELQSWMKKSGHVIKSTRADESQ